MEVEQLVVLLRKIMELVVLEVLQLEYLTHRDKQLADLLLQHLKLELMLDLDLAVTVLNIHLATAVQAVVDDMVDLELILMVLEMTIVEAEEVLDMFILHLLHLNIQVDVY
jgi:hypothetical protein